MKFQLLPSTFGENGALSSRQHLTCFVVDDRVAFDAGSLAMGANDRQRDQIRDIVLTHAHLDHIAGLPFFIDDLFACLNEPVRIHAPHSVIEVLERDIFNWSVYPRFSELSNGNGSVMEYEVYEPEMEFKVAHLKVRAIEVNHKVPSCGFIVSEGSSSFALSGDTAEMDGFWEAVNAMHDPSAILVECAFPEELSGLADISHHLTPRRFASELAKCSQPNCPIFAINLKPMYRETVVRELCELQIPNLTVLEPGRVYSW